MAYKQRSNGLPFKQMGSTPAKQYSAKIGPANEPGKTKELRRAADAVPLGNEYDAEYNEKRKIRQEGRDERTELWYDRVFSGDDEF